MAIYNLKVVLHLLVILQFLETIYSQELSKVLVPTRNGPLQGIIQDSRSGTKYVAFLGIRFANPVKRFMVAESYNETWTSSKIANASGNVCPQAGAVDDEFEDCLFLNVYVPQAILENTDTSLESLLVMVWIHGGGFRSGDGFGYGPNYYMDSGDVILVTVNYRLGIFGFLSFEDGTVTDNNGLRDQIMALRWVNENIHGFKGNPFNVTVFGESAGSASVHFLMLSPLSKGLFHKAILQSGTGCTWSFSPNPRDNAFKAASYLNCTIPQNLTSKQESAVVRQCFEKKSVYELFNAQSNFFPRWPVTVTSSRFTPTAVGSLIPDDFGTHPFFNEEFFPSNGYLHDVAYSNNVPILAGFTCDEGSFAYAPFILSFENLMQEMNSNWNQLALPAFFVDEWIKRDDFAKVSEKIKDFYLGSEPVSIRTAQNFTNIYTDFLFTFSITMTMHDMSNRANLTVYPYQFCFDGKWHTRMALNLVDLPGLVGHADELQYQFTHDTFGPPLHPDEEEFSKNLVKYWKHFAKHGTPSTEWKPGHPLNLQSIPKNESFHQWGILKIDSNPKVVPFGIDFINRVNFVMKLLQDNVSDEEHELEKPDSGDGSRHQNNYQVAFMIVAVVSILY